MPRINPSVTILHHIPGRLRMKLSVSPHDIDQMKYAIMGHPGINEIRFTTITRSLLVHYDSSEVSYEEIVLRTALSLSRERELVPVSVFARPEEHEVSELSFYSGISLLIAFVTRYLPIGPDTKRLFSGIAGLSTAAAVCEHGWSEVQKRGNFDPEVLSFLYLVHALFKRSVLPASFMVWITTFGRHLIRWPDNGVEIKPVPVESDDPHNPYYEVVVSSAPLAQNKMAMFRVLPAMIYHALIGDRLIGETNMLDQIRDMAQGHDDVLEGLGKIRRGIMLQIK